MLGTQNARGSDYRKNKIKRLDKLKGLKTRVRRSLGPHGGMEVAYAKVFCDQGCDLRTSLCLN